MLFESVRRIFLGQYCKYILMAKLYAWILPHGKHENSFVNLMWRGSDWKEYHRHFNNLCNLLKWRCDITFIEPMHHDKTSVTYCKWTRIESLFRILSLLLFLPLCLCLSLCVCMCISLWSLFLLFDVLSELNCYWMPGGLSISTVNVWSCMENETKNSSNAFPY